MVMSSESKEKEYKGKDPLSLEKITSHEPAAVKEILRI
jgi:hypothetical protein